MRAMSPLLMLPVATRSACEPSMAANPLYPTTVTLSSCGPVIESCTAPSSVRGDESCTVNHPLVGPGGGAVTPVAPSLLHAASSANAAVARSAWRRTPVVRYVIEPPALSLVDDREVTGRTDPSPRGIACWLAAGRAWHPTLDA